MHNGVLSLIVSEAFALEGVTVQYGFFPWKRSLENARHGSWEGSISWAKGRTDLIPDFFFSDAVIVVPKALFSLKEKPLKWENMEDLRGKRISVASGYVYGEAFEHARKEGIFKLETVTNDRQNILKLLAKRMDGFAMEVDTALYLMNTILTPEKADQITYHPKFLTESTQAVIFPKKLPNSTHFLEVFNRGLQKLKDSGKLDEFLAASRNGDYILKK